MSVDAAPSGPASWHGLSRFEVVNVGAAGTFVVRKPGSRARFRAALLKKLPFEADVMFCNGRDLLRLETEDPFRFGVYRRHMKTIGYLGQLDRLFAGRATTRNWNTILAIVRIVKRFGVARRSH